MISFRQRFGKKISKELFSNGMVKKLSNHQSYVIFSYLAIAMNIVTGFVLIPLITKKLGIEALGVFGLLFSLYSIIAIGGGGWLAASVVKNLVQYKFLKNKIYIFSIYFNVAYGLLGAMIVIVYGYTQKPDYLDSFYFFAAYTMVSFAMIPFYNIMAAELKQAQVAFFRFVQQFLFMLLSISSFYLLTGSSLDYVFSALLISVVIVFIALLIYCTYQFNYTFYFRKIKKVIIYKLLITDGAGYFTNGLSTILLLQIDVLLIDFLYGAKSVGIYLIIWKVPNTLIMLGWRLSDPFAVIVANKLKENRKAEIKAEFFQLERKVLMLSVLAASGYLFLGQYILELWMGATNVPNIKYMYAASAVLIVLSVMQRVYLSVNYYTHGLSMATGLQFIEIVFKCLFIVFLFDLFQEMAPVIGWLFGLIVTLLFYRYNSLRVLSV